MSTEIAPASASLNPTELRRQRGLAIAALCKITPKEGHWLVPSMTGSGSYRVIPDRLCCTTSTLRPGRATSPRVVHQAGRLPPPIPRDPAGNPRPPVDRAQVVHQAGGVVQQSEVVQQSPPDPPPSVPACTCPDFAERGKPCKHVYAVQFVLQRETAPDGTETLTQTITVKETRAPRPTYKQNWPAYNQAQRHEKPRFQVLLADLCRGIADPPQEKGRPRQPLRDVVFASVFKVYSTISGRRFMGDLADAHAKGFISKPMHYNTISKYLEMDGLTPVLRRLIGQSALPLKATETDFAVDSSGFTTSRFVRWFDAKYGQPKQEYDWVKCHLMTGVKTNVVTAVIIDGRDTADCPNFAPLVHATSARGFKINEVSADAIYASYKNYDLVDSLGGTAYIAFPSNTSGAKGGVFAKMFHYYNLNRDDFLAHYHKRSNVETTFSMIKAKFGAALRSKTDRAMTNEALAKVLAHNLCCLILSTYELGIEPVFWKDTRVAAQ